MIVDMIEKMGNYKHLSKIKAFLDVHQNHVLENGKYILDENCYLVVSEYETKENECLFEGHRKYIDLQMLISGQECIQVQNKQDCRLVEEYDEERDVAFYCATNWMNFYLDGSNFILLTPADLHNPSLKIQEKCKVKKYVFKIMVNN